MSRTRSPELSFGEAKEIQGMARTISNILRNKSYGCKDHSGNFVIKRFNDGTERAVKVYKSNNYGEPRYAICCSYEDKMFDYRCTEHLSTEELEEKLKEVYLNETRQPDISKKNESTKKNALSSKAQFAVYETNHSGDSYVALFATEKDMEDHIRQDVREVMRTLIEDEYIPIFNKNGKITTVVVDEAPEIFYFWEPCSIL